MGKTQPNKCISKWMWRNGNTNVHNTTYFVKNIESLWNVINVNKYSDICSGLKIILDKIKKASCRSPNLVISFFQPDWVTDLMDFEGHPFRKWWWSYLHKPFEKHENSAWKCRNCRLKQITVNNSLATDFCGAVKPSVRSTFVQLRYIHPKIFIDVCYVEIKYITPTTVLNWKTSHIDFDMCEGEWTDVLLDHTSSSVRWNYNHSEKISTESWTGTKLCSTKK